MLEEVMKLKTGSNQHNLNKNQTEFVHISKQENLNDHYSPSNTQKRLKLREVEPILSNDPSKEVILVFTRPNKSKLYVVNDIKCNVSNCPPPNFCTDSRTCKCGEGRVNFIAPNENAEKNLYCQYIQKKQIIAFTIEFFTNSGLGHIYATRYIHGYLKLMLLLMLLVLSITRKSGSIGLFSISSCIFSCFAVVIYILDCINFAVNNYTDRYDIPLQHW